SSAPHVRMGYRRGCRSQRCEHGRLAHSNGSRLRSAPRAGHYIAAAVSPDVELALVRRLVIVGEFDSNNVGDQMIGEGQRMLFSGMGFEVRICPLEPRGRTMVSASSSGASIGLRALHRRLYRDSIWFRHIVETLR